MAVLHNPRHEQFAQLVASGKTPAEAYVAAGYAEKTAYTCGPRLLKIASVRARLLELQEAVGHATVTGIAIDRERVLAGLWAIAQTGHSESARVRAYELCGKELGMFQSSENKVEWIAKLELAAQDLRNLTDDELKRLNAAMQRLAFGHDQAATEAAQCQVKIEGGTQVLDVEPCAPEVPGAEVPRQPEPIAGNSAPASRQLAAGGNNGGGGAVAGEPERIEAPKVDVAGDENSPPEKSPEKHVDVTVAKIPASELSVQSAWLPIWRKLLPQRETDPGTFQEEMARLAPGFNPRPAFWPLGIEAQAAALDKRFPLGK